MARLRKLRLVVGLLAVFSFTALVASSQHGGSSSSSSSSSSSTLPRSQSIPRSNNNLQRRQYSSYLPPWNPSANIDEAGFVKGLFVRTPGEWEEEVRLKTVNKLDQPCRIRQVPGDGNCLFHSISLCLCQAVNGTQWDLSPLSNSYVAHGGASVASIDEPQQQQQHNVQSQSPPPTLDDLYVHSHQLRARAVACLRDARRRLYLQGRESLKSTELVSAAAQQYGMSRESYCESMQEDSVWGGGPEIVALCNLLQRPIHVYELATVATTESNKNNNKNNNIPELLLSRATECGTTGFVLRRMACFGSPRFDRQQALHILSADSRFPDLRPGHQLDAGNHFLAVFPVTDEDDNDDDDDNDGNKGPRRKRLRGGDSTTARNSKGGDDGDDDDVAVEDEVAADAISEQPLLIRAASKYIQWWRETFQNYR